MKAKIVFVLILIAAISSSAAVDQNRNRLSDVFEFIYFHGPTDPVTDPDGDALTNEEEMWWGANPTNAFSGADVATARIDADRFVLEWPCAAGKWFSLQSSTNLHDWTTVPNGPFQSFSEALAEDGLLFWRLLVFPNTPDGDGNGFDDWEETLWKSTYGKPIDQSDLDGDGLADAQEFTGGHNPDKKDHPAVGLVVFTPLER